METIIVKEVSGTLRDKIGKALSTAEVAEYFKIDVKTARKYYQQLGGIRIGRHYRFFEMEVINAIQTWNEIYRTDKEERKEEGEGLQNKERSIKLGSGDAKKVRRRLEREDKHNLFG